MQVNKLLEKYQLMRRKYDHTGNKSAGENAEEPGHDFLEHLSEIVYKNMAHDYSDVNSVASSLCMSAGQLRRKLFALTGETPIAYIKNIQMSHAKKLLTDNPDMPISDISFKCGYSNQTHFTRAFKNMFGMTPMQWRKQALTDDINE